MVTLLKLPVTPIAERCPLFNADLCSGLYFNLAMIDSYMV